MTFYLCGETAPTTLALPTISTISNSSIASFNTDLTENLVSCVCDIVATGGGGTPVSPIAINGFSACNLSVNGTTETIPFGQTVYGGSLNVGSGVLTVTHKCVKVSDYTWYKGTTGTYARFYTTAQLEIKPPESQSSAQTIFSDNYATALSFNALLSTNNVIAVNPTATGPAINITDDRFTTGADFASNMGNTDIVFELETPLTIQLDSKQIQAIIGTNNIYADTGDINTLKFIQTLRNKYL